MAALVLFLSAICILIAPDIAGPTFLHYSCSEKQGNYTSGSAYQANLILLLSSLSSNSTEIDKGFYNLSYGEDPDKVYAILLCRGDITPDVCVNCLDLSKDDLLTHLCPTNKEAIAWYDKCMLRYSSRNIFSTREDAPELTMVNPDSVSDEERAHYNNQLLSLSQSLTDRAAGGGSLRKFAVEQAAGPDFSTIYALVQCTPDLSEQDCSYCLSEAFVNYWNDFAGNTGGRVLRPSCNFRHEIYSFYDHTAEAPPPSPPPSGKGRTTVIIVVLVFAFVVIAIFISIYFIVKKRREKPTIQLNPTTTSTSTSEAAATPPLSSEFHWDVFLNFRGKDTRKNFIDHLYSALVRAKIRTFKDDKELPRGETISTELLNAIRGSKIAIVVFSKGYAFSTWCLDELAEIVESRQTRGQTLLPIFYNMNPSDVRRHTETFAKHLLSMKSRRYKGGKKLFTEAADCSGFDLKSIANGHESEFIETIVKDVMHKLKARANPNVANIQ